MNKNTKIVSVALWLHLVMFFLTIIGLAIEAEWYFILLGMIVMASAIVSAIALFRVQEW